MTSKPMGTATFLSTDIEDSTRLAREYSESGRGCSHVTMRFYTKQLNSIWAHLSDHRGCLLY